MEIEVGDLKYEWIDNWAETPDTDRYRAGWAHHGMVVTRDNEVIAYHSADRVALVFDRDGAAVRQFDAGLRTAHGMALATEGDVEYLWAVDPGVHRDPASGYEYPPGPRNGSVVKLGLDGTHAQQIERPPIPVYDGGSFSPTSVTVHQRGQGGNGDVWSADGYGESYVHRYTEDGDYVGSINGEEGRAGRFDCPHNVWVDYRKSDPELYVCDRGNSRMQVYDLEGTFKRSFGEDIFTTPSAVAVHGDLMFVAELRARITLLDADDALIGYIGENEVVCDREGWPNETDASGMPARPSELVPGKFNSPHGIATDADGNLYIGEWLVGGRFTKLVRR